MQNQSNTLHSQSYIYTDRNVLSGTPCFSGTRIPVSLVINYLIKGWDINEITKMYPALDKSKIALLLKNILK